MLTNDKNRTKKPGLINKQFSYDLVLYIIANGLVGQFDLKNIGIAA